MFEAFKLAGYDEHTERETFSCVTSDQGVIKKFSRLDKSPAYTPKLPYGIRYDPTGAMDPNFNFKGQDAWMSVAIDSAYNWPANFSGQSLGYVNSGGFWMLVHTFHSNATNTISAASVNDYTKTLTPLAVWTRDALTQGTLIIDNDCQ
ncbi:MAG: hypothetical protein J3R72DRAFT_491228 [Linnemannia gamsii]|nr:MAG: hypothetical protein J3R72DRAFT_491228 [Linnemannia gamsii]